MLFNTQQFAVFFCAVLALYWGAPPRARNGVLLAASILFYGLWIPSYLLLLALEIAVNYALLRAIARSARPRIPLVCSILFTLGLLAYFKYAALAVETFLPVLAPGGTPELPEVFLPLGISFYSFQIIALAVDTYRGRVEPVTRLGRYALFISFFPQLIAGPILRGAQFLPQLEAGGRIDARRLREGIRLLASGVLKKVVFADFLLSGFVDAIFGAPEAATAPLALVAVYSFAFQIYFDFSGYTDMARGLARLLGFDLPRNFSEPYLSRDPSEFWRRWHITLSTWLRDYLYVPLGGNRRGVPRLYVNLMLTMLLGGLWHGAAWTFVAWGGLHGLLLVGHRALTKRQRPPDAAFTPGDVLRVLALFQLTSLFWIFFRAASFADAWTLVQRLATGSYAEGWPVLQTGIVALCMLLHILERRVRPRLEAGPGERAAGVTTRASLGSLLLEAAIVGLVLALAWAASGVGAEFIYFQF